MIERIERLIAEDAPISPRVRLEQKARTASVFKSMEVRFYSFEATSKSLGVIYSALQKSSPRSRRFPCRGGAFATASPGSFTFGHIGSVEAGLYPFNGPAGRTERVAANSGVRRLEELESSGVVQAARLVLQQRHSSSQRRETCGLLPRAPSSGLSCGSSVVPELNTAHATSDKQLLHRIDAAA